MVVLDWPGVLGLVWPICGSQDLRPNFGRRVIDERLTNLAVELDSISKMDC